MSQRIKILVATHSKTLAIENDIVNTILVGSSINNKVSATLKDDSGENISHLNKYFCELTAHYWAYKNLDLDYYGFFHYRRYLALNRINSSGYIAKLGFENKSEKHFGLNEKNIKSILNGKIDWVLPLNNYSLRHTVTSTLYENYRYHHNSTKDLDFVIDYLKKNYPSYTKYIDEYLFTKSLNKQYFGNIFIAKKQAFMDYCKWLFEILFAFQEQKDYSNLDLYQSRIPGFLAERLFGIYIYHAQATNPNLKILHVKSIFILNSIKKVTTVAKIKSFSKNIIKFCMPYGILKLYQNKKSDK
ncbi:MAG: DUF4422 domain-containing protein [Firmicutes bacterium]|nr:DUF4422 domain-containing protein [Bacillota bacterium]MCL1953623.1 DUF4422 domain-containing protein [Bacillota bacterium]